MQAKVNYSSLAHMYDQLMGDAQGFEDWMSFVQPFTYPNMKILDLACGSGELSLRLSQQGFSVIGLDLSEAMLEVAKSKDSHHQIDFRLGDMRDFDLKTSVDMVICAVDSLHYLENIDQLHQTFTCVKRHLNDGGIFIFDLYKKSFAEGFAEAFEEEGVIDDLPYHWQIEYEQDQLIHTIALYKQSFPDIETHIQTLFSVDEVIRLCKRIGFEIDVFDGLSEKDQDEKYICVARKEMER